MTGKPITILQLYPKDMNIYGDYGNTLTLRRRLEWYGYHVELVSYNPGDALPETIDIIVGGGGQDSGQTRIQDDLLSIGTRLHDLARDDTPMLMICGLYQLFGKFFHTQTDTRIEGIGLFNVETFAGSERLIGNIITESETFGTIVGYENHSGQTYLGAGVEPLGIVRLGAGNNSRDGHEGSRYRNVIGSYLHGSLLPKNPAIADFLIEKAIERRYGDMLENAIDDRIAKLARDVAITRPR